MNAARRLSTIGLTLLPGWIRRPGIILVALTLSLTIPIAAVVMLGPRQAPEVTLVVFEGEATITNNERGEERVIQAGDATVVGLGEEIRVADASRAQLTFFDGATSDLFEGTELKLDQFRSENNHYQVRLDLAIGKITTQIQRLLTTGESFEVITPSSAVTVRGTVFTVEVFPDQSTEVSCDEGIVAVTSGDQEIELHPGDSTRIEVDPSDATEATAVSPPPIDTATTSPAPTATSIPTPEVLPTATSEPTSIPAPAVPSNVEITSQVESVWYCTAQDGGSYQWYEVELIFHDGVKVEERVLSGPYTGGWQPNCPGSDTSSGDASSSGSGDSGGGSGVDCLVDPEC